MDRKRGDPIDWIMEPSYIIKPREDWSIKHKSGVCRVEDVLLFSVNAFKLEGANFLDVLLNQFSHVRMCRYIL